MYCKADFKSIAKCKKWLCAAVFSLFLKNMRRAANLVLQSRCKAILAPPQSTPKNTKTGRKSVGFLILTQAPKCTRSHCFPPQKHPKNGFVMRFAGKNSFLQVRSAHVLILSALSQLRGKDSLFDKIIVDESQDLMQDRYLDVMDMCLSKGLTRGRWTMFGDFSMQAIYTDGLSGPQLLEKLDDRCSFIRFKLTINCRNTKPICSEIEIVTGFKAPNELWTKVEGPPVQYITWTTMDDQQKKLQALLGQLVEKRIPPEQITILSPKKKCESVVSLINGYTIRDFKVPPGNSITFCTIQGYKGLENTIVILTDIEGYSADKLMYVGLSRACSALFVFETEQAKGEYDALLMRRLLNE